MHKLVLDLVNETLAHGCEGHELGKEEVLKKLEKFAADARKESEDSWSMDEVRWTCFQAAAADGVPGGDGKPEANDRR